MVRVATPSVDKKHSFSEINYDYNLVQVYKNKYIHIFYVWSHNQRTYHHRWSSMITYSMYVLFVRSDMSYIMRYTHGSNYKRA